MSNIMVDTGGLVYGVDTGWKSEWGTDLYCMKDEVVPFYTDTNALPAIRRINNSVFLSGYLKVNKANYFSVGVNTEVYLMDIHDSQFYPKTIVRQICQCSGFARGFISIYTNGQIKVSRIYNRTMADNATKYLSVGHFINIECSYFIN